MVRAGEPEVVIYPPRAYVPGRTPRHPEGLFDAVRGSVRPGMGLAELAQCRAWRTGWAYLDAGFYWEAHELFEPVWLQLAQGSPERHFVQAAIQTANAGLKARMGRPRAVRRLLALAEDHLHACRGKGAILAVPVDRLTGLVRVLRQDQPGEIGNAK